jgi:hypothetical protein
MSKSLKSWPQAIKLRGALDHSFSYISYRYRVFFTDFFILRLFCLRFPSCNGPAFFFFDAGQIVDSGGFAVHELSPTTAAFVWFASIRPRFCGPAVHLHG